MIEAPDLDPVGNRPLLAFAGVTRDSALCNDRNLRQDEGSASDPTPLGADRFSDRMISFMTSEGLEFRHIEGLPNRLPVFFETELEPSGERSFRCLRAPPDRPTKTGIGLCLSSFSTKP